MHFQDDALTDLGHKGSVLDRKQIYIRSRFLCKVRVEEKIRGKLLMSLALPWISSIQFQEEARGAYLFMLHLTLLSLPIAPLRIIRRQTDRVSQR